MPDQLTPEQELPPDHGTLPASERSPAQQGDRPPGGRRDRWQAPAVLVLFLLTGAALGVLWEHLWSPTEGIVVRKEWFVVDEELRYDLDGLRNQFAGTALFVSLSLAGGAAAGVLSALLLAREELRTLFAVALGSVAGSVLMWQVGTRSGPSDPDVLARTSPRGTALPDDLALGSLAALMAMPTGALLALAVVFLLAPSRPRRTTSGDPR